ncbi:intein-containing Rv2578c family radical SAM protein [Pseudonocardia sp. CA-107938]|uniref:intein-containing Rv2578c family radical SAM protein n=1 Tax=Pseudonocardia sp. CA-107938 TaxID=3240021 RepID=UPI003D8D874E
MRWSGQQVLDDGVGAEPALPGLRGLLRTVRPPEFAGITFHEVEARSALNRVPGASRMPFTWTVNPYRGCSHACVYCLAGPTRILLADGSVRPIAELRVGDAVLGTEPDPERPGARRYVPTRVLAHWSTRKPAHTVRLAGGTTLVTSAEHRFLSDHGWRHVAPGWCRAGRRPHLRAGTRLLGIGRFRRDAADAGSAPGGTAHTGAYRRGYLCGLVRSDGPAAFPSDRLPLEVLGRAHHYLAALATAPARPVVAAGVEPGRMALVAPARPARRATPAEVAAWPADPDEAWCAGFLAGCVDARGVVSAGELRIEHHDEEMIGRIAGAVHRLGFGFVVELVPDVRAGVRAVRLAGGAPALMRLLQTVDPAVGARHGLGGAPVTAGDPELEVVDVRATGRTIAMYDITTGTGDFVAEGVISHNCFARNTHTYLDLDAGTDFDTQIVVKTNVARVLERELRAPRWQREQVAMGTNTDPYQRAEGRYRLMPGIVRALARSGTPLSILTKGTVLQRDLPELVAAAADVPVGLGVSIALLDRELQARLEPGTPSPTARLDMVRRITDAGLECGVMVAPVLPLLTDSAEQLDAVFERIAAAGATGATVLALHLRRGTREWFLQWLERERPDLVEPYAQLYRRGAYVDKAYRDQLAARVAPLLRRHGLDRRRNRTRDITPPERIAPTVVTGEQLTLL